ncbi:MAG: hypothetical protein ACK5LC_13200 [Coprobacillaceae bacterium]
MTSTPYRTRPYILVASVAFASVTASGGSYAPKETDICPLEFKLASNDVKSLIPKSSTSPSGKLSFQNQPL